MVPSPKVLLVTADSEFRSALAARLAYEGALVTVAGTGAEALSTELAGFELAILDLELPDIDGLTVLRRLRDGGNGNGAAASAPIFLLKSEGEPAHLVQRGFDFGASGYVVKHRLPRDMATARILEPLLKAASAMGARRDVCPFSSHREFNRCSVFLPLNISIGEEGSEPLVSCSHLRIGASDTWRLYPRCAIGDQPSRDRYLEGRTPV